MGRLPDFEVFGYEWIVFLVLAVLRVVWTLASRRRLIPILDLPLLGVAFVFTGGEVSVLDRAVFTESPLDPALFLIYALLAFYLEQAPRARSGFKTYGAFLLGFLGMYGLVLAHVRLAQQEVLEQNLARLGENARTLILEPIEQLSLQRSLVDDDFRRLRERIDAARAGNPVLSEFEYFSGRKGETGLVPGGATIGESYELFVAALEQQQNLLREAARYARPDTPEEVAQAQSELLIERFNEASSMIDGVIDRMVAVAGDLMARRESGLQGSAVRDPWYENLPLQQPFHTLDVLSESQRSIYVESVQFFGSIRGLANLKRSFRSVQHRMISQRVAIAIMILATLYLLATLRRNFEVEVERREMSRAAIEVRAKEQEKDNWIALTAGLTHTIGNDILAYDAYGEEALEALEEFEGEVPEGVERNLRFIYDSNKARLGFIKFLDEFARARKDSALRSRVQPEGLTAIVLEPLLLAVRQQVGIIEVSDLPSDSREPQVVNQRKKFLELPMRVVFLGDGDEVRSITRGKPGILRFFFYELVKNALRNCSGEREIVVEVEKVRERVILRFVNDLAVRSVPADDGRERFVLPRIAEMEPCSGEELRTKVASILDQCFEPGRGGGTGLGLFLIRYFAREYYSGSVTARIHDWERRLVAFELDLPDDLENVPKEGSRE
ncbi:MAG: hypothetical protein V2A76_18720 [Planctomycetota bacterium]